MRTVDVFNDSSSKSLFFRNNSSNERERYVANMTIPTAEHIVQIEEESSNIHHGFMEESAVDASIFEILHKEFSNE